MPFGIGENIVPGGLDAISSALQRRRMGDSVSPLSQVSGAAPTANNPNMQAPPTTSPGAAAAMPPSPANAPSMGTPSEAELIIKALSNRLAALSKREAPPQAPSPAPMGV